MSRLSGSDLPSLFQSLQMLLDPIESLDSWSKEYGDTFRIGQEQTSDTTVCFSTPEAIRTIFKAPSDTLGYSQKSRLVKSLLGDSSFIFLSESEHQRHRKLIIPNWHKENLITCGENIVSITKKIIGNLIIDSSFDVRQIMRKISLDVILEEVLGANDYLVREQIRQTIIDLFNTFDSPLLASYLFAASHLPLLLEQEIGIWAKVKHLQRKLNVLIDNEIAQRKYSKDHIKHDFLFLLINSRDENGELMNSEEIRQAVLTLIFAGFETAAASLSWMLYWVYYIPEVRGKLANELSLHLEQLNPLEIERLPYLSSVCNETLRITPPALSTFARSVKKPLLIDGYYLEPGTIIDVSIYLAHKREAIYPEPEKFKPERFLEKQFSPYEFLPFGGGQCRCLGASLALYEMKLVLATIVSNFNLELIDPKPLKPKRHGIVMIPPNLKMKIV